MIIPPPRYEEPEVPVIAVTEHKEAARIRAYLDVPNWKCSACGAIMFGRCKFCAYCKFKLGVDTWKEKT